MITACYRQSLTATFKTRVLCRFLNHNYLENATFTTPWLIFLGKLGAVWWTTRVCLRAGSLQYIINDLPLHVQTKSVDCDMLADDTTLHTSGKDISKVKCTLQDCLDQVANWCNSNSIVNNPMKTHYMAITTRQNQQLSPLPLDLILNGVNSQQVTEHRHLEIIIGNKLRWTHSPRVWAKQFPNVSFFFLN